MHSLEPDEIFWQMGASEEAERAAPVDAQLRGYLDGRLAEEERTALEGWLATSPAGRQRLAELASVTLDEPSAEIRARVLAALPRSAQQSSSRQPSSSGQARRSRRGWGARAVAAAAGIVAVGLLVFQLLAPPGPPPTFTDFEVSALGLAAERAGEVAPGTPLRAYPATQITIMATAAEPLLEDVEYRLYLLRDDRLHRLPMEPEARRYDRRFSAPAGRLVGDQPGRYALFVAAGARGELPKTLDPGNDPLAALRAATAGPAQAVAPLELLAPPGSAP